MIQSTLRLYAETAIETVSAIARGPFVWLYLLVLPLATMLISVVVSPLGMIGGFIAGFAIIYLYGAYLYAVGQSVERKKPLGFGIIQESMGHHLWDLMGVAFLHFLLSLAFQFGSLPSVIPTLVAIITFILFNPWPEVIHSERAHGSMEILVRAFRFMQSNGPEWIVPHILLFAMGAGVMVIPGDLGPALALGSGIVLHPVMIFRAVLFRKLGSGSRRSRSWRNQF